LPRIALALALAPLAVSAIALVVTVGADYKPAGDIAIVEMTTRAVGEHWPLVGNHSRDGWHHRGRFCRTRPCRSAQEEESDVVNDLAPPVLAAVPSREGEVVVRGIGFLGLS
jgi:hypothetical protein